MSHIDSVLNLVEQYGPFVIFVCLFFGVVGIPAPEETLVVIVGILIQHHALPMFSSVIASFLGVFCGFLSSYAVGRYAGAPVFYKITKRMKMSEFKVQAFQEKYEKNYKRALLVGLFIPGARQINPYLAGISKIPFIPYVIVSLIGTSIWVFPFMILGYATANVITIKYEYLPFIGIAIGLSFISYFTIQHFYKKKKNRL